MIPTHTNILTKEYPDMIDDEGFNLLSGRTKLPEKQEDLGRSYSEKVPIKSLVFTSIFSNL